MGNNPVNFNDPTGHWVETVFDVAMIGVAIADIHENGLNWGNGLSLGFDVAAVILPGIPAIGAVILKGGKIGKAAVEIVTHVDDIRDTIKAVDKSESEVSRLLRKIGRFCTPSESPELVRQHLLFYG